MWTAAQFAAHALKGIRFAGVSLGAGLPEATVEELAQLAGVKMTNHGYTDMDKHQPGIIFAFSVRIHGVEIHGQGSRPLRAADLEPLGGARVDD